MIQRAGGGFESAPVLSTDRLSLRPYVAEDFEPFASYFGSSRSKFTDGPIAREAAWDLFCAGAGRWALVGYGAWSVERRADGAHVGLVSLNTPIALPEPELGWILWDGFEGAGYAYEAAIAARTFAWSRLNWAALLSCIHVENAPSIRLAERLGCVLDGEVSGPDPAVDLIYRHPADKS